MRSPLLDALPDARDGLTRKERVVLWVLHRTEQERPGRSVATTMLYGRVLEYVDISIEELQYILVRLGASQRPGPHERR